MACLTENEIVDFFASDRSPDLARTVDAHTAECERCRRLLAEFAQLGQGSALTAVSAALPSLTPSSTSQNERIEVIQRLAQAQAKKHIGAVLKGKWQIEELLGTGGMAHVFAARHRNGRRVAIKTMRPELVFEREFVDRFLREGYVANKIDHPGAVAILDDDVMEDGTPFLVMELLVGRTLRQRLEDGPLNLDDAMRAVSQALTVLAVAHDKGIIHRDLKPDNLFETEEGTIKVLDFGIARLKERTRPEFETRSGMTMGTVGYMPPEQARGLSSQVDARSDVWAMGATLYALITGKPVHRAATTNEALLLAMTSPVESMDTQLPHLPRGIRIVLDTALAFDKERRYPNARAMQEALERAPTVPEVAPRIASDATVVMSPHEPGADVAVAATIIQPAQPTETMLERVVARKGIDATRPKSRAPLYAMLLVAAGGIAAAVVFVKMPTSAEPATLVSPSADRSSPASASPSFTSNPPVMSAAASVPAPIVAVDAGVPSASVSSGPTSKPAVTVRPKPASAPTKTPTVRPQPPPVDTRDPLGPRT